MPPMSAQRIGARMVKVVMSCVFCDSAQHEGIFSLPIHQNRSRMAVGGCYPIAIVSEDGGAAAATAQSDRGSIRRGNATAES